MLGVIEVRLDKTPIDVYNVLDSSTDLIISIVNADITGDIILDKESYKRILFHNCRFKHLWIRNSELYDVEFINCSFDKITLDHSNLIRCDFIECNIINVVLIRTRIDISRIYDSNAFRIEGSVHIDESKISYFSCNDIILNDSSITRSIIDRVKYNNYLFIDHRSAFLNCFFSDTSFYMCRFEHSYFYKCTSEKLRICKTSFDHSQSYDSIIDLPLVCPAEGSFIAYKNVLRYINTGRCTFLDHCIAVLEIPADAKRISAGSNKCRCSKAKAIRFESFNGEDLGDIVCFSDYNNEFKYKLGEMVYADSFDENKFNQCSTGIHFFMNREEATHY